MVMQVGSPEKIEKSQRCVLIGIPCMPWASTMQNCPHLAADGSSTTTSTLPPCHTCKAATRISVTRLSVDSMPSRCSTSTPCSKAGAHSNHWTVQCRPLLQRLGVPQADDGAQIPDEPCWRRTCSDTSWALLMSCGCSAGAEDCMYTNTNLEAPCTSTAAEGGSRRPRAQPAASMRSGRMLARTPARCSASSCPACTVMRQTGGSTL